MQQAILKPQQMKMESVDDELLEKAISQTEYIIFRSICHAKDNGKKIYLAFSGGKDSLVLNHICKRYFARYGELLGVPDYTLIHNLTGIDTPTCYKFLVKNFDWNGRERNKNGSSEKQYLKIAPPLQHFFPALKEKGIIPTFAFRWCCNTCKHKNHAKDEKGQIVFLGIRSGESRARAERYDWFNQNKGRAKNKYKCIRDIDTSSKAPLQVCPILHWSDSDIWNYIKKYNIELPKDYTDETQRLGCQLCPMQKISTLFMEWLSDTPFVRQYKRTLQRIIDNNSRMNPWPNPDIWVALVWFINIKKLEKKHMNFDESNERHAEACRRANEIETKKQANGKKPRKGESKNKVQGTEYLNYYYYYYQNELEKDPYFLFRNDKWFKELQKQGRIQV